MKIKTIGDLRKIINNLDDDFKLEMDLMIRIPDEELIKSSYPWSWRKEDVIVEFHDIGYSEKTVCFGVYRYEDIDK